MHFGVQGTPPHVAVSPVPCGEPIRRARTLRNGGTRGSGQKGGEGQRTKLGKGRREERISSSHAGELLVAVPCWRRTDEAGKTHVVGARGVECSEIKSMESHELNA